MNFAIFLAATVANSLVFRRDGAEVNLPLMLLNPALYYGFCYTLAQRTDSAALGWGAILLAVVYWAVGALLSAQMDRTAYLSQLATGVGFVFAILAVPVLLRGRFLTVAWAGEAAMLLIVAARAGAKMTRRWGLGALALAAAATGLLRGVVAAVSGGSVAVHGARLCLHGDARRGSGGNGDLAHRAEQAPWESSGFRVPSSGFGMGDTRCGICDADQLGTELGTRNSPRRARVSSSPARCCLACCSTSGWRSRWAGPGAWPSGR